MTVDQVERIWNEIEVFAPDLINPIYLNANWRDVPSHIRNQFVAMVSRDNQLDALAKEWERRAKVNFMCADRTAEAIGKSNCNARAFAYFNASRELMRVYANE